MISHVLVKVYGDINSVSPAIVQDLRPFFLGSDIMELSEMLIYNAGSLQIAFEGIYFDIEDVLNIVQKHISQQSTGKIDYLDLEAWKMTRHRIDGVSINSSSVGLNNVLDYAGL